MISIRQNIKVKYRRKRRYDGEYSKDKVASLKPRRDLVNAMEMLLSFGYEEEAND